MQLDREKYLAIRHAQKKGVRTMDELQQMTDIVISSEEEKAQIEEVLKSVCKCKNISIEEAVEAVKNGADTLEKVIDATGAGTVCGRCKGLLENIVENKR